MTPSGAEAQPLVQDLPVSFMASPTSEEAGSTTSGPEGERGDAVTAGRFHPNFNSITYQTPDALGNIITVFSQS